MLNIVVPMAGRGQRFSAAGFTLPKPLIPVHGVPMIELVIRNLRPSLQHRFHFIIQSEHQKHYWLDKRLAEWAPGSSVTVLDEVTEGAACTVLRARDSIDSSDPLMIANCDQYIDASIDTYLQSIEARDGLIMTMKADDPKWSYVVRNSKGRVVRVVEKEVVSNEATVGVYNFSRGADFVRAADAMIKNDRRVNGEFYVAPVYDQLIAEGANIECFSVGEVGAGMHGLGTPDDLADFLETDAARRAVARIYGPDFR